MSAIRPIPDETPTVRFWGGLAGTVVTVGGFVIADVIVGAIGDPVSIVVAWSATAILFSFMAFVGFAGIAKRLAKWL